MKHKRVFWMLVGNENTGSSRIHGYNIHNALLKKNIYSEVLLGYNRKITFKKILKLVLYLKSNDILIVQKIENPSLTNLLKLLKIKGVRLAYIDCDLPVLNKTQVKYFDYIICPSKKLQKLYQNTYPKKNILFIPDAVEYYIKTPPPYNKKAIYFGWLTNERLDLLNSLKSEFLKHNWEIVTMSNREKADVKWKDWHSEATFEIINDYCVSVIPIDSSESAKYKSANRVLQSLALGNIVLCGDIDSYNEVIEHGENGFICNKPEDWADALHKISKTEIREKIIKKGYEVAEKYHIDNVVEMWISNLDIRLNEKQK